MNSRNRTMNSNTNNSRWLSGTAILIFAITQMMAANELRAQSNINTISSFDRIKQINAGVLNVGYAETGPSRGEVVILLHGWPYDIYSYAEVASLLAAKNYRVIVPYLRGYGTTRFLSETTPRNGQQSAIAADIIALMDALKIDRAIIGGFDWGARTANIMAALWPERVKALVSVSGYLIGSQQANQTPLSPKAELSWWYQYYFATERGAKSLSGRPLLPNGTLMIRHSISQ
jgi:pimeloyl-ACP methyl ester carboxylesterase